MENSNICTICNEFTFDQQNEHNIKVHQIACKKKQNKLKTKTQPKVNPIYQRTTQYSPSLLNLAIN